MVMLPGPSSRCTRATACPSRLRKSPPSTFTRDKLLRIVLNLQRDGCNIGSAADDHRHLEHGTGRHLSGRVEEEIAPSARRQSCGAGAVPVGGFCAAAAAPRLVCGTVVVAPPASAAAFICAMAAGAAADADWPGMVAMVELELTGRTCGAALARVRQLPCGAVRSTDPRRCRWCAG